jgi:hypothetical protein
VKSTDWENNQTTNSYYFNSSVLGRLLFEVDGSGGFKKAYAYSPSGQLLARQESNGVTWVTTESQGATTKETNSSGTVTGTNELDPLGRAVDSSGAYNYDGTNDYGVPAAGFYTPGSVPGVCGTTFGVSMSCGIVRDWGIHQRSLQERIADNDWSLSRLRPNGEFWDNLDRGYVMIPEFEDHGDRREVKYRKYWINPPPPPPPPPPGFDKDEIKYIDNALKKAEEITKKNKCDKALSKFGIPSLNALLLKYSAGGSWTGRIDDGRQEAITILDDKGNQVNLGADPEGIPAFVKGGTTYLNSGFFSGTSFPELRRAIILIHEAVHQFGNLPDLKFNSKNQKGNKTGSRNLTKTIVENCYPVAKSLIKELENL